MTPLLLVLLSAWPAPDAALTPPPLPAVHPKHKLRVLVDAGHGAPGNHGNIGATCQVEADFTLAVARALAKHLKDAGPFDVRLSRDGNTPGYHERIRAAEAWKADAVVSLHSDARGWATAWQPWHDERVCYRNDTEPGFSVLWSREGSKAIVSSRERLGRAIARRMRESGFGAYSGINYGGLYVEDEEPGGWIDVHELKKRIYFLRATTKVPVVIVETHHALDVAEAARWNENATRDVFGAAVAAALVDFAWPAPAADAGASAAVTTQP